MLRLAVLVGRRTAVAAVLLLVVVPWLQARTTALAARPGPPLVVTGDVQGLVPGRAGRLVLTIRNDGAQPALVRRLTAVSEEQVAGCALAVEPWSGRLAVAGGAEASQALVVRVSGPRCEGRTWRLAYAVA